MNEKVLNFAAWVVLTALAGALVWTGKAPILALLPSVTWLLPAIDWVSVAKEVKK